MTIKGPATDQEAEQSDGLVAAYVELLPHLRRTGARRAIDADDVAQDAYVRILQLRKPGGVENPLRYLFRVARNLFIDEERARTRASGLFDRSAPIELQAAGMPDPERILAGKQRLALAVEAIERLPPRCREAFNLHRFDGLSYAAIARRMGISISAVEKHIAEAMIRLSKALIAGDQDG